jgi:hypothetical protein
MVTLLAQEEVESSYKPPTGVAAQLCKGDLPDAVPEGTSPLCSKDVPRQGELDVGVQEAPLLRLGSIAGHLASSTATPHDSAPDEPSCGEAGGATTALGGLQSCRAGTGSPLLDKSSMIPTISDRAQNAVPPPFSNHEGAERGVTCGLPLMEMQTEMNMTYPPSIPPRLKDTPLTRWLKQGTGASRSGTGSRSVPMEASPAGTAAGPLHTPGERHSIGESPCFGGARSWDPKEQPPLRGQLSNLSGMRSRFSQDATESSHQVHEARTVRSDEGSCHRPGQDAFGVANGHASIGSVRPWAIAWHSCSASQADNDGGLAPDGGGATPPAVGLSRCRNHVIDASSMDSRCPGAREQLARPNPKVQQAWQPSNDQGAPPVSSQALRGREDRGGALLVSHEQREAHLGVRVIWVAKESQRKGIAEKLLDAARCAHTHYSRFSMTFFP